MAAVNHVYIVGPCALAYRDKPVCLSRIDSPRPFDRNHPMFGQRKYAYTIGISQEQARADWSCNYLGAVQPEAGRQRAGLERMERKPRHRLLNGADPLPL